MSEAVVSAETRDAASASVQNWHDLAVGAHAVDLEELEWRMRGAEGEWYERHTISQDLPQFATDALVAGWDTQSLRVLAGEPPDAYSFDLSLGGGG